MGTLTHVKTSVRQLALQLGPFAKILVLMCFFALFSANSDSALGQGAEVGPLIRNAEQGDAKAQVDLGTRYKEGKGVAQNYQEALKWYRKAAEHGDTRAFINLGLMYKDGKGAPANRAEAVKWLEKAFLAGNQDSKVFLQQLGAWPVKAQSASTPMAEGPGRPTASTAPSVEKAKKIRGEALAIARAAKHPNDYRRALQKFQEALAILEAARDEKGIAIVSYEMGFTYRRLDESDKALDSYSKAIEIAKKLNEKKLWCNALRDLGYLYSVQNDHEKAMESAQKALEMARELKEPKLEVSSLSCLGNAYREAGLHYKAAEALGAAIEMAKSSNDPKTEAKILNQLGLVHSILGQYVTAQQQFEKALELAEKNEDAAEQVQSFNNLGSSYFNRGQYREAYKYHKKAHELAVKHKDIRGVTASAYSTAQVYVALSKYSEAEKVLQLVYSSAEKTGNVRGQASALNQLGRTYCAWSRFDQGEEYYKKALEIHERAQNFRGQASTLLGLSSLFGQLGKNDKSLECRLRAKEIAEKLGDARLRADALMGLGNLYYNQGNYKKAEEHFQTVAEFAEKAGAETVLGGALANLARVYEARGQYKQAADYVIKYGKISLKSGNVADRQSALLMLGGLNATIGRAGRAVKSYELALAMAIKTGDIGGESRAFLALASVYGSWGRYDQAIDYREKALQVARETGLRGLESDCLVGLGEGFTACGQYDKALECIAKALEIRRSIGHLSGQGSCFGIMGNIFKSKGEYEKAINHYKQSLDISEKLGRPTVMTKSLIADCYLDIGAVDKAEAIDIGSVGKAASVGARTVSLCFVARLLLVKGDHVKAKENYLKILREAELNRRVATLFAAYTGLGLAHEALRDYQGSAEYFRKAIEVTEEIRAGLREDERTEFYNVKRLGFFRTVPYEGLARVLFRLGKPEESLKVSEFTKARAFAEALSRSGEGITFELPGDVLETDSEINQQLAALVKEEQTAYEKDNRELIESLKPQLAELRKKLTNHISMLRKDYPLFAATKYPQPMELAQTALRENEWAVVYDVTDSGVLVYLLRGKTIAKGLFKPIPRKEMEDLVRKFREPLEMGPQDNPEQVLAKLRSFDLSTGKKLSDLLLGDVLGQLAKGTPVMIVPDECLGVLPFEMLPLKDRGKIVTDNKIPRVSGAEFFGDRNLISYHQSITGLTLSRTLGQRKKSSDRMLVMADPVYRMKDLRAQKAPAATAAPSGKEKFYANLMVAMEESAEGGASFKRLLLTGDLARRLSAMFSGSIDSFTGLETSKAHFLGQVAPQLDRYGSIVFACHGYFGAKIPGIMEPVLVLTTIPHGTDGFLRMSEVMGCRMNADVVALTACQTGLGKEISGEGTMGMGRAFQYAGAKSVLMSLWSVSEGSSVQLVESFFKRLKEGKGKLEALKLAKDEIRKAGYDHPFFWAPFILVGEVGGDAQTSRTVPAMPAKPPVSTGPKTQDQASVTEVSRKHAEKVVSFDDSLFKAKEALQRRAKEPLKAQPEQLERFLHYEKLRMVAEQEGNQDNLFTAYTGLGQVNEALNEYTQASDSFDIAAKIAEKARSSLSQAQRVDLFEMKVGEFSRTTPYEGRTRVLMKMKEFQNSLESSEYTKARTYIELLSTRRGSRNFAQPLQFDQLALKEDDWLLVFGLSDQGVIIYLMNGRKIITVSFKPIARDELGELVHTFRKPLETAELSKFDLVSGKKIADLLLQDILGHLPKNTPVIIVPDGVLNLLPFESLVLNSGGEIKKDKGISYAVSGVEFFGDRNPVSYVQSLTALTLARTLKRSGPPADKVLVMADPVYSLSDSRSQQAGGDQKIASKNEWKLNRLPATGELARALAEMHKGKVDIFAGLDASKSNLLNKIAPTLGIYDAVVFATHYNAGTVIQGVTEPVSFLTMVPPGTDGFLRMSEIENLKMNCQIAVLLGAQSAVGKVRGAEGLMSMARAFQLAGARCVLASLWPVTEKPSVQLVEGFFRHIKLGKNKSEALGLARHDIRKAGYDHPFFWAPFILIGEVN